MVMRGTGDYMMVVGREFLSSNVDGNYADFDREWAQRVRPSDGLIIKEK